MRENEPVLLVLSVCDGEIILEKGEILCEKCHAGEQPEYREEFHVMGEQLVTTVEQLVHEGNVSRIIIKHEGHTVLEIPLTIGVVGMLVAPMLAAVGAIGAAVTNCTIEVVRTGPPEQTGTPSRVLCKGRR